MSPNAKFNKERSHYVFVSAPIIHNPARQIELAAKGSSILAEFIVGPCTTYFKRRNQAKRERNCRFPIVRCTHKVTP